MTFLLLIAFAFFGVAVTYLVKGTMGARAHADERVRTIDLYGYGAAARPVSDVPANSTSGALAFAQRVGDIIGNRFGTDSDSKIRKEILAAGLYTLTPRALVGYQVVGAALGGVFGLVTDGLPNLEGPIIDTIAFAGIGWMVPITYVRRTGRLRTEQIERGVPEIVDLVVVSVEAGQGFAQALQTAADRTEGPLGDELKLTLQEQRFGLSMDRALENLNMRADTPNMRTFVRGVVQGERLGVSIGTIMRNIAVDMRMRRRQAAEERAQKTTVKILIPVVFFILPPFILILMAPAIMSLRDSF